MHEKVTPDCPLLGSMDLILWIKEGSTDLRPFFYFLPYTLWLAPLPGCPRERMNYTKKMEHVYYLHEPGLHWHISEELAYFFWQKAVIYLFVPCVCFFWLLTYNITFLSGLQKWKIKIVNWIHMEKSSPHPRPHRLPILMSQVHTLMVLTAPSQASRKAAPARGTRLKDGCVGASF